jgi:hypothetical protein
MPKDDSNVGLGFIEAVSKEESEIARPDNLSLDVQRLEQK